jgi:DNA-binding CsgD family transcriptional regulator
MGTQGTAQAGTQLVERDAQLDALRSTVASRQGRVVLLTGEAGAGKSSLVQALAAHTSQRVLMGACDNLRTPRPFGPVLDWARTVDGDLADLIAQGATPDEVLDGALALLSDEPTLAVIEDLHWIDDATTDLVRFLGRRLDQTASTLVLTYRPDEVVAGSPLALALGDLASRQPHHVPVPALTRAGVAELAAGSSFDVDVLTKQTAGNAFFVTACLASGETLPQTVRDAVLARLFRLSQPAIDAAQIVSIFPGSVTSQRASELGANAEGIEECLNDGVLIQESASLRFRHELGREAVYGATPAGLRRGLHREALVAMEASDAVDPTQATHHALESGDVEAALRHATVAADVAERAGARTEAIAHLELCVSLGGSLSRPQRVAFLLRLAKLCNEVGALTRSIEAHHEALDLVSDPRERGLILSRLWNALSFAGQLDAAQAALRESIELLEGLPPGPELALAYAQQCSLHMLSRQLRQAEPWGERAMMLATEFDDVETLVYSQIQSGVARMMLGNPDGLDRIQNGIGTARRLGLHPYVERGLSQVGCGGGEVRLYGVAVPALREAVAYSDTHELGSSGLYSAAWLGRCLLEQGQWDEASSVLEAVTAAPRLQGISAIAALTALGRLRARRGDADPWACLDQAFDLAQRTGQLQRIWPVTAARAEAAWLEGRLPDELGRVREGYRLATGLEQPWATGELGWWAHRAGDLIPAEGAAPYAHLIAGDAKAAAAAWRHLGCPYDEADALALCDDDDQLRAWAIWTELGAAPALRLLADARRAQGLRIPRGPNASTLGNAAGLTSRELEILRLVAQGLANPDIARDLHLSAKTVGHHVSHILEKLGVRNRTEAVTAAAALGVLET